jgi:hypothetical protein
MVSEPTKSGPIAGSDEHDFRLEVHVRLYGDGSADDAADALRDYKGTFDLPGDREVEILAVFTDDEF